MICMCPVSINALEQALERSWSAETSATPGWANMNRAQGQCAVTACVAQDYLGGEILNTTATLPTGKQISHYLNLVGETLIDFTDRQFPEGTRFTTPRPKTKGFSTTREYCLSYDSTRRRYELLSQRVAQRLVRSI